MGCQEIGIGLGGDDYEELLSTCLLEMKRDTRKAFEIADRLNS